MIDRLAGNHGQAPRPYTSQQVKAQRLMAVAVDPKTRKPLEKRQIAALVGVGPWTISRWIHDKKWGGSHRWYAEVNRFAEELLDEWWPLHLKKLNEIALTGKNAVAAIQTIGRLRGKYGPESEVNVGVNVLNQNSDRRSIEEEIEHRRDNGRSRLSSR